MILAAGRGDVPRIDALAGAPRRTNPLVTF